MPSSRRWRRKNAAPSTPPLPSPSSAATCARRCGERDMSWPRPPARTRIGARPFNAVWTPPRRCNGRGSSLVPPTGQHAVSPSPPFLCRPRFGPSSPSPEEMPCAQPGAWPTPGRRSSWRSSRPTTAATPDSSPGAALGVAGVWVEERMRRAVATTHADTVSAGACRPGRGRRWRARRAMAGPPGRGGRLRRQLGRGVARRRRSRAGPRPAGSHGRGPVAVPPHPLGAGARGRASRRRRRTARCRRRPRRGQPVPAVRALLAHGRPLPRR